MIVNRFVNGCKIYTKRVKSFTSNLAAVLALSDFNASPAELMEENLKSVGSALTLNAYNASN